MKHIFMAIGAAILSSLCCIVPVLAIIAGTSGFASTISWLEPFRSFLVIIAILVLGFSWFQKLRPRKEVQCECETNEKPRFIQSKTFLGIVTVFAISMLLFPNYAHVFYTKVEKEITRSDSFNIQTASIPIEGMTCTGCEAHISYEVDKLPGIIRSTVSYSNGSAVIEFDSTETNISEIEAAIKATGYKVAHKR